MAIKQHTARKQNRRYLAQREKFIRRFGDLARQLVELLEGKK